MKNIALISIVFWVFGIALGSPVVAEGEIIQSLLVGVKQDPAGGFTNADLNGTYRFRNLSFDNVGTSSQTANIGYGSVTFDGNGAWTGSVTDFDSGGSTESGAFDGIYSVNSDGSYTFTVEMPPPGSDEVSNGHISRDADSQFSVLSHSQAFPGNIEQGIITAVREPQNPFVSTDINGTWQFRDLEFRDFEADSRDASACSGTINITNPNWAVNLYCLESDGTKTVNTVSGTYALSGGNFIFHATGDPAVLFSANRSRDGNILIFTGSTAGSQISMFKGVALKKTARAFTNADLSATYFIHEGLFANFESDNAGARISSGTVTFNGGGYWTATTRYFDSSAASGSVNSNGTYSVNSDGSFTLTVTSETPDWTLAGNISSDTDTIILSNRESSSGGGYSTVSGLWLKAVLQVPGYPVTLVWKEVGTDTTPNGAKVVSGYFYADPKDFAYGSQYNPEVFVKIYIAANGWCNIAFNHVTVDAVSVYSAHNFSGAADVAGSVTLNSRLEEHQYDGVGLK